MEAEDRIRVLTFSLRDSVVEKLYFLNTEGNRSAVVSALIEDAWAAHQSTHTPSLQPRPNAGQAPAGNLRGWVRVGNCRARAYSKAAASTEGEP